MSRNNQIKLFLENSGWGGANIIPLAGDASFRRYDRIELDGKRAVLMDAPTEFENTRPFVAVAEYLTKCKLDAPKILSKDFDNGFLLLEDLGDDLFKKTLERDPTRELELYKNAVDELLKLNACEVPEELPYGNGNHVLPHYNMELLLTEITLFTDWYYPAITGKRLSFKKREQFFLLWQKILKPISDANECLVLRDYHSENLLDLEGAKVGQLDFQDAVIGHSAYDLVSLLQDARRDVGPKTEEKMICYFCEKLGRDENIFSSAYAVLGAQRNLKIIGIFARLSLRDGKDNYLKFIPRVWGLIERCLEHPVLKDIKAWLDYEVPDKRELSLEPFALMPNRAMILAAGLGTRMKSLTANIPKPLIEVAGKAMLGHTLDALAASGIKNAVINKHHHAEKMDDYVKARKDWRPEVILSDETDQLMDSGGGVKKALSKLGSDPFYILNSDMIWTESGQAALSRLATHWRDDMDILMLLIKRDEAHGHEGPGNFNMDAQGRLYKCDNEADQEHLYGGILIIRPECFDATPDTPFSLRDLFFEAMKNKRLYGLIHHGLWYHVGTPEAVKKTEKHLMGN